MFSGYIYSGIKLDEGLKVIKIQIIPNASKLYFLDLLCELDNFIHPKDNIPRINIPLIKTIDFQSLITWKAGSIVRLKGNNILRKYSKGITPNCVRKYSQVVKFNIDAPSNPPTEKYFLYNMAEASKQTTNNIRFHCPLIQVFILWLEIK